MKSEVLNRYASRRPSLPKLFPVVAPVVNVKLELIVGIVVGKGVADAEGTIPGWTEPAFTTEPNPIVPLPPLPLTVIRTVGRR